LIPPAQTCLFSGYVSLNPVQSKLDYDDIGRQSALICDDGCHPALAVAEINIP
jgi:hypothetical protein